MNCNTYEAVALDAERLPLEFRRRERSEDVCHERRDVVLGGPRNRHVTVSAH